MAIATGIVTSFRSEILGGLHDFTSDVIKLALFDASATLNSATTLYAATNEVSGTGYTAGGQQATTPVVVSNGSSGIFDSDDFQWTASSFTARGALLYNSSTKGGQANRAIATIDFGGNRTVSNGTFTVQLPAPAEGTGFVEIDDA